jgi:hypothetical protein
VLVELRDGVNNLVTTPTLVTAAVATGTGSVTATTAVTTVNGVATFDNLKISGSDLFTLTFSAPGAASATSGVFSGNRPATQVGITRQPVGGNNGAILPVTPLAVFRDVDGYKVLEGTGTITVTTGNASYIVGGSTTSLLNPGPNGANFPSLTVSGTPGGGPTTLVFSAPSLTSATSNPITLVQRQATIVVTTPPAGALSGVPFTTQPVLEIRDDAGYVVTGATCEVTASKTAGPGTFNPGGYNGPTNGVVIFSGLSLTGAGAYTLKFAAALCPALATASVPITVAGATATTLAIAAGDNQSAVVGHNVAIGPSVLVTDASGAPYAGAAVTFAVASGGGFTGSGTYATNVSGIVTTFWTLGASAGANTLTATVTGLPPVTFHATGTLQLALSSPPGGTIATKVRNASGQPVLVELRDGVNNLVTTPTTVTAQVASGAGTTTGTIAVTTVGGVATFDNLKLSGSDLFTLVFSTPNAASVTSGIFSGNRTATQVGIKVQPVGGFNGAVVATAPLADLRDADGYKVLEASSTITVAVASGNYTLSGASLASPLTPGPNGAGYSGLIVSGPPGSGPLTLVFSAPGMTSATSNPITVTQRLAHMAVATQPAGAVSGVPFTTQPVVEFRDDANYPLTNLTCTLAANMQSGTGGLGGTTFLGTVTGVGTYSDLRITGTGSFTLRFTANAACNGLTTQTATFTVAAP